MATRISRHPQLRGNHALSVFDVDYVDGNFVASSDAPHAPEFDFSLYSDFKYGRRDAAEKFAGDIAATLERHLWPVSDYDESFVITGTPYKRVPNAARTLAFETFRYFHLLHGKRASYTSIYQPRLASGDYAKLSGVERDKRNDAKARSLDPSDFAGKNVILIDDVRITGSIERSTIKMLETVDVLSISCVNLVKLNPEIATQQPHLESELNHFSVKGLDDILILMHRYPYVLNTRAIKYILQADLHELERFLHRLSSKHLSELYQGIVDEGYDQMANYQQSFDSVLHAVKANPTN